MRVRQQPDGSTDGTYDGECHLTDLAKKRLDEIRSAICDPDGQRFDNADRLLRYLGLR